MKLDCIKTELALLMLPSGSIFGFHKRKIHIYILSEWFASHLHLQPLFVVPEAFQIMWSALSIKIWLMLNSPMILSAKTMLSCLSPGIPYHHPVFKRAKELLPVPQIAKRTTN